LRTSRSDSSACPVCTQDEGAPTSAHAVLLDEGHDWTI
jgi:hypothetical protein